MSRNNRYTISLCSLLSWVKTLITSNLGYFNTFWVSVTAPLLVSSLSNHSTHCYLIKAEREDNLKHRIEGISDLFQRNWEVLFYFRNIGFLSSVK